MVGTSIFENFLQEVGDDNLKNFYYQLKDKRLSELEEQRLRVSRLREGLKQWLKKSNPRLELISAEVKSIYKLKEELREELEIYLLSSDTVLSYIAANIIKEVIANRDLANIKDKVVSGLQISDRREFNKGLSNLISEIYSISEGYWKNIIINITGGYKATIPYLTILAQINQCPVYYIFESSDSLIKIPNIPLSNMWFNLSLLAKYEEDLEKLNKGVIEESAYYSLINSDFYKNFSFLIWEEKPFMELNPIGKIIYNKYKERIFEVYATEEVIDIIESNISLKRLFQNQFADPKKRESKTENKNGHLVYDAGDNPFRIFYRIKNGKIYVYKVFDNHDVYENFLRNQYDERFVSGDNFRLYKVLREEV